MSLRVLHVLKNSTGALWVAQMVRELCQSGVETHVSLPDMRGRMVQRYRDCGAIIQIGPGDIPARAPWQFPALRKRLRELVDAIKPDLIHAQFYGCAVLYRWSLGRMEVPRLFQTPGPLHLNNARTHFNLGHGW